MPTTENAVSDKYRAYRRRKLANGRLQFIADLPRETVALLDELKERQGLRNRGQVLEQLIEIGRTAAQQH
jgi:transposase